MNGSWLTGGRPGPDVALRLFCLPFAGGGAAAYHRWPALASRCVHVSGVEYPGRGMRVAEEPFQRLPPLVRDLADRLEPYTGQPYALFGHSMGGLVAYELTRALRTRNLPLPRHLFLSGVGAPGTDSGHRSLAFADDDEVLAELRALGGTPPELLHDRELMAMAVRALRADSTALATYEYRPGEPLDVPFTVFGGDSDELAPAGHLRGWRLHTIADCRIELFPGGHFFLHSAAAEILHTVHGSVLPESGAAVPVRGGRER